MNLFTLTVILLVELSWRMRIMLKLQLKPGLLVRRILNT